MKQVKPSIPRWLYDRISEYFQENREDLRRWGVKSVNGLISTWLQQAMDAVTGHYQDVRGAVKEIKHQTQRNPSST